MHRRSEVTGRLFPYHPMPRRGHRITDARQEDTEPDAENVLAVHKGSLQTRVSSKTGPAVDYILVRRPARQITTTTGGRDANSQSKRRMDQGPDQVQRLSARIPDGGHGQRGPMVHDEPNRQVPAMQGEANPPTQPRTSREGPRGQEKQRGGMSDFMNQWGGTRKERP